jgi:hypothetical protein
VVEAEDLEAVMADLSLDSLEILWRDQVSVGIGCPAIHHRQESADLLDLTRLSSQHAAAFPGIGPLALAMDCAHQPLADP